MVRLAAARVAQLIASAVAAVPRWFWGAREVQSEHRGGRLAGVRFSTASGRHSR